MKFETRLESQFFEIAQNISSKPIFFNILQILKTSQRYVKGYLHADTQGFAQLYVTQGEKTSTTMSLLKLLKF